ncbi:cyclic 2,3-diphosphoglycerate synthase [[Eubacterium] cellulosolvens]
MYIAKIKIIIMGAAGRDFHNFNVYFRNNPTYNVVAFTAEQIPGIADKKYPAVLAGKMYTKGIPIYPERMLPGLIRKNKIEQVVLSYSDLPHTTVMAKASSILANGADFRLLGPIHTMLRAKKPVIAICAVRTGAGKSPTTRKVCEILRGQGKNVVVVRHPMPYGDLASQVCQRFATMKDLDKHNTTIEEREEYEPHIENGTVVYAGVDYQKILNRASKEGDIIIWDGGNNDIPFYKPDLHIVVADPLRPGHEISYYPGATNLRMADVVVISKVKSAAKKDIDTVQRNIKAVNKNAKILKADLKLLMDQPKKIKNKKVLVVEDGPTITHGDMPTGAGYIAAKHAGARAIIDPRPYLVGSLKNTFKKYPHIGKLLPAMGYGNKQVHELEATINKCPAEIIVTGTPIDLTNLIKFKGSKEVVRVRYEYDDLTKPGLKGILKDFLR